MLGSTPLCQPGGSAPATPAPGAAAGAGAGAFAGVAAAVDAAAACAAVLGGPSATSCES